MSFFSNIGSALHTFAAWFEKEWTKLYNVAPKIEHIADATLAYVGPALQLVLAAVDPAAAAIIAPIIAAAQKDLKVASGLIYDFGPNPNAASIISAVEKDLQDILSAGHITDAKLTIRVTAIVNSLGSLATAILNSIAAASAPAA